MILRGVGEVQTVDQQRARVEQLLHRPDVHLHGLQHPRQLREVLVDPGPVDAQEVEGVGGDVPQVPHRALDGLALFGEEAGQVGEGVHHVAELNLTGTQHDRELVKVVDDVAELLVLVGESSDERAEVGDGVVEALPIALEVVGGVLDQATGRRGVEAVEELLEGVEGLVGLHRDFSAFHGDDVAAAGAGLTVGPHREQLHVALADERQRDDGGMHVGGDGHALLDLHLDPHAIAHGLDLGDLAGRKAQHADLRRREQSDRLREPGGQDGLLLRSPADDRARRQQNAGQDRDGNGASHVGHVTPWGLMTPHSTPGMSGPTDRT